MVPSEPTGAEGESMLIKIAGILHPDPLGPERLSRWLSIAGMEQEGRPQFVAVEFDEEHFKQIADQRQSFRELVKSTWPDARAAFVDALVAAFGYEGDTHRERFRQAETLWLDAGRECDPSLVSEFAQGRLLQYRQAISDLGAAAGPFDVSLLKTMSRHLWATARRDEEEEDDRSRDSKWAAILAARAVAADGWGIAIVGANHGRDAEGRLVRLLREGMVICEFSRIDL
jgi:hypothetical protein